MPSRSNLTGKGFLFLIQCELSGIRLSRKLEVGGEIGAVPTTFLWLRWAKMARNGAAESGGCSSGQRGAAYGRIGLATAVSLLVGLVCLATLNGNAHRRSQEQQQEDAWAAAAKNAQDW